MFRETLGGRRQKDHIIQTLVYDVYQILNYM